MEMLMCKDPDNSDIQTIQTIDIAYASQGLSSVSIFIGIWREIAHIHVSWIFLDQKSYQIVFYNIEQCFLQLMSISMQALRHTGLFKHTTLGKMKLSESQVFLDWINNEEKPVCRSRSKVVLCIKLEDDCIMWNTNVWWFKMIDQRNKLYQSLICVWIMSVDIVPEV